MKKKLDKALLLAMVAGGVGLLLNMAVVLLGYTEAGLPKRGFFIATVLPFYAFAAALYPLVSFFKMKGTRKYLHLFTASTPAAGGIVGVAASLLILSIVDLAGGAKGLSLWRSIVGILGALALIPCALCRKTGKRPVWLCWGLVTVYFVLTLVGNYSIWSSQPVLNKFLYQLLANSVLMLTAYQQSAADAGIGSLKEYLILSLMCVVLCPIAMMGSSRWLMYLAFFVYHVLNLMSLDLSKHKSTEGE